MQNAREEGRKRIQRYTNWRGYDYPEGREKDGALEDQGLVSPLGLRPLVSLPSVCPTPLDSKCLYLPGEHRLCLDQSLLGMPVDASKME